MPENSDKHVRLVDMRQRWFRTDDGQLVNLEESTPAQFDTFIAHYLEIEDVDRTAWPLLLRWRAVNFAVKNGQFLAFCDPFDQEASVS